MPKVSICIPAYNQVEHLKKTIDSVISQTYTDYEIVITDDSPTSIVADFVKTNYSQINLFYYKNPKALGTPENWNESIRKATGEYIKILHHDDWLAKPESLGIYVSMLDKNPLCDFAFSATEAQSKGDNWEHVLKQRELNALRENPLLLYSNNLIGAPSTGIFRRSIGITYDKQLQWLVDIDFYIQVLRKNSNIEYSHELLLVTFIAEGRVTDYCISNKQIEIFEYFYLLNKIYYQKNKYPAQAITACMLQAISICDKYKVMNIDDIAASGYSGKIPLKIKTYLSLKRKSYILAKGYKKIFKNSRYNKAESK